VRRGPSVEALVAGVLEGDRALLARAITKIESERPDHRAQAEAILAAVMPHAGGSRRIAVSGPPGAGKSTFIDAFGAMLLEEGRGVAVLAIDPSSPSSGGSILGDKTRMVRLSRDPRAFIRPSPAGRTLGGVAAKTRETILLCEAAGFDVVIVETVGVGQSETMAAQMVDFFLVLLVAGAGDELQGIKRGILELADMLAVNKADGENQARAEASRRDYQAALRVTRGRGHVWDPPVLSCSGLLGLGLPEIWERIEEHRRRLEEVGALERKRAEQAVLWMWRLVEGELIARLRGDAEIAALLPGLEDEVRAGELAATTAARRILRAFLDR